MSTTYLRLVFLVILSIAWSGISSQTSKVIYPHAVFWSKTEVNELFGTAGPWGLGFDFVFRSKSGLDDKFMFSERLRESYRPWIHYQFGPNARLSISPLGYMKTHEYIGKPEDLDRIPYYELRTTLQFFHHQKQLNGKIMHTWRYRYEFRFQNGDGFDAFRYLNRFRFRYRIRYVINGNNFYSNKTWYLAVSNEIGLNFGKNVFLNTFNQNRLYIGAGYRFLNAMRVETRYVNRIRSRGSTGFEFDHGQGFMLGIYIDMLSGISRNSELPVRFTD